MSDGFTKYFKLDIDLPGDVVIDGFLIQRTSERTKLVFRQYRE